MTVNPYPVPAISVREYHYDPDLLGLPALSHDEVHVWHQDLTGVFAAIEAFGGLLSAEEVQRASRFHFDDDCKEYIVSRGTLRVLLGMYLNVPPQELRFAYSKYGRPSLVAGTAPKVLEFNVSHSGGVTLLAFARGRKIGIDVEEVRRDFGTSAIAERFFSGAERAALQELPQAQRHEAFFRCWTRKEAFIKALGEGLSHPLDQFDVSLAPESAAILLATRPDAHDISRWKIWNIKVPADYAAALAVEVNSSPAGSADVGMVELLKPTVNSR
jgi:4'-phosphopantetheinyl transferase